MRSVVVDVVVGTASINDGIKEERLGAVCAVVVPMEVAVNADVMSIVVVVATATKVVVVVLLCNIVVVFGKTIHAPSYDVFL